MTAPNRRTRYVQLPTETEGLVIEDMMGGLPAVPRPVLKGGIDRPGSTVLCLDETHVDALRDLLRWFDPSNDLRRDNLEQMARLAEIEEALR